MEIVRDPDPYAVVLADLRAKRQQIDHAIAAIEALQSGSIGAATGTGIAHGRSVDSARPTADHGALLGMSIADAAKKVLQAKRGKLTTPEIVSLLEQGGVVLTSADKNNTVGSLLLRRFYNVGDIVRVNRGVWGLQEWYPGRKFTKGNKVGEDRENGVTTKEAESDDQTEQEVTSFDKSESSPCDSPFTAASAVGGFADDLDDDIPF